MPKLFLKWSLFLLVSLLSFGGISNALSQSGCTPEVQARIMEIQREGYQIGLAIAQGAVSLDRAMQYAQQLDREARQLQTLCPGAFGSSPGGSPYGGSGGYEGGNILRDGDRLYAPSEGLACDSTGCYGP